ncbi:hypothetical protein [Thermus caldifontis]|uniref:hypothetical protein n=1 Tax=Thermus caldifontis TaxID=1930763 RepID=UPI001F080346|nr:hypothetical protein [Thermus caldifontis]
MRLLAAGEAPVLLLPKALTQVRRIAVGLDESPASLSAFRVADLLVLGSKAKSTWRHRLGRMVEVLSRQSSLPLLVVPEATVW